VVQGELENVATLFFACVACAIEHTCAQRVWEKRRLLKARIVKSYEKLGATVAK
jgi:hypothetical protein